MLEEVHIGERRRYTGARRCSWLGVGYLELLLFVEHGTHK